MNQESGFLPGHLGFLVSVLVALLCAGATVLLGLQWVECFTVFVTLLVGMMWVLGVTHTSVPALLPIALFPLFGVCSGKAVAVKYFTDTQVVMLGSYLLAIALEEVGGHKKLALKFLSALPGEPRVILAGFMVMSALMSAFMSNTATSALMLPAVMAVYEELKEARSPTAARADRDVEEDSSSSDGEVSEEGLKCYFKKVLLGIAYSCTLGGSQTLTGTGPNLVFALQYQQLTKKNASYGSWSGMAIPYALLMLIVVFVLLTCTWGGLGLPKSYRVPVGPLKRSYTELGPSTHSQFIVYAAFLATIVGWILKGSNVFQKSVTNGTVVMTVAMTLFFIPRFDGGTSKAPKEVDACGSHHGGSKAPRAMILEWHKLEHKLPFNIFFLIGAGSAISLGFDESGLSKSIGNALGQISGVSSVWLTLIVSTIGALLSQVTSDIASAQLLLPIAYDLAVSQHVDPLTMMVPLTLACSLAFSLPISTAPNAIVFAPGLLGTSDFLKNGVPLILIGLVLIHTVTFAWGLKVLGADLGGGVTNSINSTAGS